MRKAILLFTVAAAIFVFASSALSQTTHLRIAPKTGVWTVAAKDEEGTKWSGRLHLSRRPMKGSRIGYRGYFYWISADRTTSGNEYFNGNFDRSTGKLRFRAYKVRNIKGELGTGNYVASVTQGRKISRGSWGGQNSIPGTWSAVWKSSR